MISTSGFQPTQLVKMETCVGDITIDDDRSSQRKANKPLMEKRRRARINRSLMELKSVLVESLKKSSPGHSKWEKADILEMTVQYLQCLKNQQQTKKSDPLSVGQFIAGFSECIRQIQKFNSNQTPSDDGDEPDQPQYQIDPQVQQKLCDYLLSYLKNFSDDATKGLQSSSPPLSPSAKRHSPGARLKGMSTSSGYGSASPTSHHSPTSSSLSPKSPAAISPGRSSATSGSSIGDSPRKAELTPTGQPASFLTLCMPGMSQSSFAFPPTDPSSQTVHSALLQRLQIPPSLALNAQGNQVQCPVPIDGRLAAANNVWRPW